MEETSNMDIDTTVAECETKEVGISAAQVDDVTKVETSKEHEDNRNAALSLAEREDKLKNESPGEKVNDKKEGDQHVKNASEVGSSGKKTSKVLKVKRKVLKKSPATSTLKAKKAQDGQEGRKKEKEAPAVQEVKETVEAGNSTEKCNNLKSTKKKVIKVKRKIVKKSAAGNLTKTNKVQDKNRLEKDKSVLQAIGEGSEKKAEDAEIPKHEEDLKKNISEEEPNKKNEEIHNSLREVSELSKSVQEQKNVQKDGLPDKSTKKQKNNENGNIEKIPRKDKNKEELGGLIFMCSAKTKPDCFHYNVMGVPAGKKDLVLAIKPGLKLFLYDFDLRLLYGIYTASSSGGMKLEPKAFHGAFPAQVRFSIYKDCFPLPESIFKKAMEENFYEKHKFKAELTKKQVRKLSDLFKPVGLHSNDALARSPPRASIWDKTVHGLVKEDDRSRYNKSEGNARSFHLLSHERGRKIALHDGSSRHREEASRGLYIGEKDYRTYGLPLHHAERINLDPMPSALGVDRDYHSRHPEPRYNNVASARRDIVHADHVYFNGKDYPVYSIDPRPEIPSPRTISASVSERNAYNPYSRIYDGYLLPSKREEGAHSTYSARNYAVDTEPVRHAVDALTHYNRENGVKQETAASSRYSFAGSSYSHR